jgi:general secretion pathway protein G
MKRRGIAHEQAGFTLIELLIVIAIIGILAAIAIPNLLNAVQRGKQKRTMSDMRALATALEAYTVDNSTYPAAACQTGIFTTPSVTLATNSFTNLSPTYIANVPKIDGWGEFLQYGSNPPNDSYVIVSGGRNKTVASATCGTTTNFNDDIYYSNGTFIQWPEGTQY